jgi:dipicolinate synthase subunit B
MRIGFAYTGSFCTISRSIEIMKRLMSQGIEIIPIMSENAYYTDTRFGKADSIRKEIIFLL